MDVDTYLFGAKGKRGLAKLSEGRRICCAHEAYSRKRPPRAIHVSRYLIRL
jgi:hypothetical protein